MTFSGYKKSEAKKELLNHLYLEKLKKVAIGPVNSFALDIFDIGIYFLIYEQFIHLGNPKLPTYMELRFNDFRNIITGGYIGNEIKLRNNNKIRHSSPDDLFIVFITKK